MKRSHWHILCNPLQARLYANLKKKKQLPGSVSAFHHTQEINGCYPLFFFYEQWLLGFPLSVVLKWYEISVLIEWEDSQGCVPTDKIISENWRVCQHWRVFHNNVCENQKGCLLTRSCFVARLSPPHTNIRVFSAHGGKTVYPSLVCCF